MKISPIHSKLKPAAALVALLCGGAALGADAPDFFQNGTGARPGAMGGAFVAVADDVNAIYYNPAGMVTAPKSQFGFLRYGFETLDVETNHVSYLHRLSTDASVGVALGLTTNDNNLFTSYSGVLGANRPVVGGSFTEKQTGVLISYAQRTNEKTTVGATARYLSHKLPGNSETGFGLDLGLLHRANRNLNLGVNLQNLIPTDLGPDQIPFNAKLGAAYTTSDGNLLVAADYNTDNGGNGDGTLNFGLEYKVLPELRLRAGSQQDDFTLGMGLEWGDWQLDYAYMDQDIGNVSRVGFNYYPDVNPPSQKVARKAGPVISSPPTSGATLVNIVRDLTRPEGDPLKTDVRFISDTEAIVNLGQIDKIGNGDKLAVVLQGKVSAFITITEAGRFFSQATLTEKAFDGTLNKGTLLGDSVVAVE